MGTYINKGNEAFRKALNGNYVDKTGMIAVINKTLNTVNSYTCVTRCRRSGKSLAAKMLCAYYDKSCDSRSLFDGLYISQPDKEVNGKLEDKQFEKHLNKYLVICLDITKFTTRYQNDKDIVKHIQEEVKRDVLETYPDVRTRDDDDLMEVLLRIAMKTGDRFIMLIDEWDALCQMFSNNPDVLDAYRCFFGRLFKGSDRFIFAGCIMFGSFSFRHYKLGYGIDHFGEYHYSNPGKLYPFYDFTYDTWKSALNEMNKMYEWEKIELFDLTEKTTIHEIEEAYDLSKRILADTFDMNETAVAKAIEQIHDEDTNILSYNDEKSLACVLSIAYYYAKNDYIIHRELPTGKGFADLVLIPRRYVESPALVLELKYNKDANAAIDQIKQKNYPAKVAEYTGDILLVGINYDKNGPEGKKHTCKIEHWAK